MILYVGIVIIGIIVIILIYIILKKRKRMKPNKIVLGKKKIKSENEGITLEKMMVKKDYEKYNVVDESFLVCKIGDDDHYLTWRYAGQNHKGENMYNLVLLPYQNKQNQFQIHVQDYNYLKNVYEKYGMYNTNMKDKLNEQVFATSKYNNNSEQYLELEKCNDDENYYVIRASLWLEKGPMAYLHLDDKNKLYFVNGKDSNIARFTIE